MHRSFRRPITHSASITLRAACYCTYIYSGQTTRLAFQNPGPNSIVCRARGIVPPAYDQGEKKRWRGTHTRVIDIGISPESRSPVYHEIYGIRAAAAKKRMRYIYIPYMYMHMYVR